MSIYKDKSALDPDYQPETLPHRENQIAYLRRHFSLILKELTPRHIFIHGAFGSGKTVVIKHVMNFINQTNRGRIPIRVAHIRCKEKMSTFKIMQEMSLLCFPDLPVSNPRLNLYNQLDRMLDNANNSFFLFILDEMNKPPLKEITPILHYFSRRRRATGICISNNPQALDKIPPDTHDSFKFTTYCFPPYDSKELLGILQHRAELAFNEGVIEEGVLEYFAAIAWGTGSARVALNLLAGAAELVEAAEEGVKITKALARNTQSYVENKSFRESVITMPYYYKLVFSAFQIAKQRYPTPTVDYLYRVWCTTVSNEGLRVLTKRRYRDFLTELKGKGFIDIIKHGKGRRRGWDYYVYVERLPEIIQILGGKISDPLAPIFTC